MPPMLNNLGHQIMMNNSFQYRVMNSQPMLGESYSDMLSRQYQQYEAPKMYKPPVYKPDLPYVGVDEDKGYHKLVNTAPWLGAKSLTCHDSILDSLREAREKRNRQSLLLGISPDFLI
jgi:hypothetical protein